MTVSARHGRWLTLVAALCIIVGLALLLVGRQDQPTPAAAPTTKPSVSAAHTPTPTPTPTPTASPKAPNPAGEPTRVVVTSSAGEVLVDATVAPTTLKADGALEPPFGVVGWYAGAGWPRPGWAGASILAGHINSQSLGPDTFARLTEVRPGDVAEVTYDSGATVAFTVTRSEAMPKSQVPQDDSIWDVQNPKPLLRLITCDPGTPLNGGHYVGNWVVWADVLRT